MNDILKVSVQLSALVYSEIKECKDANELTVILASYVDAVIKNSTEVGLNWAIIEACVKKFHILVPGTENVEISKN